ncbi:porin [Rouxiella sp. T17]|uniref:porin n=1 Tax=Rouxiella sp. T17 TaxID=3085684 RepID=UPI002FC7DAD6
MMKRKYLAVLVSALLVSNVANAVEIYNKDSNQLDLYGKVVGLNYISNNGAEHGDKSYARLGFKGATQMKGPLSGYGQWEYNLKTSTPESAPSGNATRLAFAGLRYADIGSFDYGRNFGVLYDVEAWTDVNPEFGGDSWAKTDNFMTGRANNLATFRTNDLFGMVRDLKVALQYQGKNEGDIKNKDRANATENGDGWGVSSSYDLGNGVSIAAAYAKSDRTDAQSADKNGQFADAWTTGVKFDANSLYLAAMYAETRNMTPYGNKQFANKTQNIELVAQYQFTNNLRPSISYVQSTGKSLNKVADTTTDANSFNGGQHALVKYVEVGTSYFFNKNMYTYIDYKINLLKKDNYTRLANVNTDNVLGLGLVYQF